MVNSNLECEDYLISQNIKQKKMNNRQQIAIKPETNEPFGQLGGYRLYWVDNVKGLAILLVIYNHVSGGTIFNRFISSFHVPVFFVVTGYLLFTKHETKIRNICTLITPYLCFSVFENHEIKCLTYLSKNSLIIMCTHMTFMLTTLSRVFTDLIFGKITWYGMYISGFVAVVLVVCVEIPIIYVVNNYMPFILGRPLKNHNNFLDGN